MPRQRKYRAYQPSTGKMFYFAPPELTGENLIETEDWVVMDYVGFADQDGKDIYEGDVLRYIHFDALEPTRRNGGRYKLVRYRS